MASSSPQVLTSASGTEEDAGQKEELIGSILELQNTLHDLTQRVNSVKEENTKLKSENEVSTGHTHQPRPLLPPTGAE